MTKHDTSTFALKARWVLPMDGDLIENGVVVVSDGQIQTVMPSQQFVGSSIPVAADYGNAIITPGLINLHTHLDYTDLALFDTQSGFFNWIRGLVAHAWQWNQSEWQNSALNGAAAIAQSGTTLIADSSYTGEAASAAAVVGLRAVVGLEIFGIDNENTDAVWQAWLEKYDNFLKSAPQELKDAIEAGRVTITIAPHTPYTVCPALWQRAKEWAESKNLPILVHIAESKQESEWIASHNVEVEDFLKEFYVKEADTANRFNWRGQGHSPVEHLLHYGLLNDKTLAAHAVHLSDSDIQILKDNGVGIAHCPRSNSRLRNGAARLLELIKNELKVGLGTDSSASVDDLSVLNEACFAWNLHRAIDPNFALTSHQAIAALTSQAAKAIGLSDKVGTLTPGKQADIAVFGITGNYRPDISPYDQLLYGETTTVDVFVAGNRIVQGGKVTKTAAQLVS